MKKENLAINTLVFLEQLNQGIPQEKLIETVHKLGISKIEIRREFIRDFDKELDAIYEKSKQYGMEVYYSVPELLYEGGNLLFSKLETYFNEAKLMNATRIKLCIGDYSEVKKEDVEKINELIKKDNILLTVENDQTAENGWGRKIKKFLDESSALGGKILATFDIGNWLWQKEDPMVNAKLLKEYVGYIHLKDVKGGINLTTVLLDQGDIDWRMVLTELPNVSLALEYPCGMQASEQLVLEIQKITKSFRKEEDSRC